MLTGKTIGQLTNLANPTSDTLFPVELSGITYHIDFASISNNLLFEEVTYSELYGMYTGGTLSAGYYKITDFQTCYDQPDYDQFGNPIYTGNYRTADIDPIIVFATSNSSLAPQAYQPSHPKDKITYDITFTTTERTNSPAKGRITERIDEYNNRTDYDHKAVKFKRYTTYFVTGSVNGRITGFTDYNVYGKDTTFTSDLTVGDVIFIEYNYPKFFEITNIISDTEMTVYGYLYDNFTDNFGYQIYRTETRQSTGPAGSLYYFNDVGTNDISDGGDDMYDGGNEIYTNLYGQIPYTHTQMSEPPVNESNQASFSDFTYDGTVQSSDTYFGTGSQYFTNLYPGLFVMVAKDVSITDFEIDGNLGSDGDGQADLFDYTLSLSGNDFSVYCKRVWDAGDPSVNHIFIVNTIDPNITHDADLSTDDDRDTISNLTGVTQVHYLLFGLAQGVKPTNTQIENIVLDYLSIVDLGDINNTLSGLNANFSAVTSNLPIAESKLVSLEYKQNNISGDTEYYEQYTFANVNYFANNYIGNHANMFNINDNDFILSNNVFTNADDNTVDIDSNNFGDEFYNNSFGDDVISNLFVGSRFHKNTFYDRFRYNIIKQNFYNNVWYDNEFNSNNVGDDFYDNWNNGGSFNNNEIGNEFNNNAIIGTMYENKIAKYFSNNKIYDDFYRNDIGDNTYNNSFYGVFYQNEVSGNFQSNNFWSVAYKNEFGESTNSNNFGTYGLVNTYSIINNTFGRDFNGNTFSGVTNYNQIQDFFESNQIATDFSYNIIGNNFSSNIIQEGFGFGGGQSQKNIIGDYFQSNNVGEYFYNNRISNYFNNNTIGNYFQRNNIDIIIGSTDFTTNYGNVVGVSYNAPGSTAVDGTYFGVSVTGGTGVGVTFDISVSSNVVTAVLVNQSGKLYTMGDTFLVLGSVIGGTDGVDDVTIQVVGLSATPSVYEQYNCNIFQREGGANRLSYYDSSDTLIVKNIDA